MDIATQRVEVDTGSQDERGCLVFHNGKLVALLCHLQDPVHGRTLNGKWFLEFGLGALMNRENPIFDNLESGIRWVEEQLS